MIFKPFKGPGSTPARRRFWDQVAASVSGSTKQAGRHVTVSEHQGKGTFINVADTSARRGGVIPPVTCCDRDCDEISTIDVTLSIDATFHDSAPNHCGTGSRSETFSWHFDRISKDDTFDCDFAHPQFKLYLGPIVDGCCTLHFNETATACSSGVYSHNWGKADNICEDGDMRFPLFEATFDEACSSGTLRLRGGNPLGVVEARFKDSSDDCLDAPCIYQGADTNFTDLANDIPITTCDLSALIGTYTLTHTHSNADSDVRVTVTFIFA